MKILSLMQPWATLVALGEKKIETRSWKTKYRGLIYIHASQKIDKKACSEDLFKNILFSHGYTYENLPNGMIIAKCMLIDINDTYSVKSSISAKELELGDYSDDRFAWILNNIEKLENPIKAKGRLGLWNYEGDGIL